MRYYFYLLIAILNFIAVFPILPLNPILSFACMFASGASAALAYVDWEGRLL